MFNERLFPALLMALILFIIALGMGVFTAEQDPSVGEDVMNMLQNTVFEGMLDESPALISINIFLNNLEASLLLFLGGATFGLLTLAILSLNGIVIGVILDMMQHEKGILFIAAAIVPHGIFEIPAFLIAGALGFLLTESLLSEMRGNGDMAETAKIMGRKFILIVVPLLAVAAVIEGFITPEIINLVI